MKSTDHSPAKFLEKYIAQFNVPMSEILVEDLHNLNVESDTTGHFDAAMDSGNWDAILENLVTNDEPFTSEADTVKKLHQTIFEETNPNQFKKHIHSLQLSKLNEINASLFQFKHYPTYFVLYVNELSELNCSSKINEGLDWVLFEAPSVLESEQNIIEIQYEDKVVHLLCTTRQILVHTTISQPLPTTPPLPSFIPEFTGTKFTKRIIHLGYALRFRQISNTIESKQVFMDSLNTQSSQINIPVIYRTQIEQLFDEWYNILESTMPSSITNDSEQIVEWLINRDITASIFSVLGQWKPITKERLNHLDEIFPLHVFSYLLPESQLLAEAWFQDPSSWWGQGAALSKLLDQSSSI